MRRRRRLWVWATRPTFSWLEFLVIMFVTGIVSDLVDNALGWK